MKIEDGTFKVFDKGANISVMWVIGEHRVVGITDADFMWPEIGRWWLCRVNINNPEARSLGVGSKMLNLLKAELVKHTEFKELLVAPGGYGSDETKQWNFYTRNGFVSCGKDGLLWKPESRPS